MPEIHDSPARRIGLALNIKAAGQQVFLGVVEYARPFRRWTFFRDWANAEGVQALIAEGVGGIIGTLADAKLVEIIEAAHLPAVNVDCTGPTHAMPSVLSDDPMIGELAADYLHGLSCRHYAFFGSTHYYWSEQRRRGFIHRLTELRCGRTYSELLDVCVDDPYRPETDQMAPLTRWLKQLPKPVGIFCANDKYAFCVHSVCHACDLDLQTDVQVLGVDHDPMFAQGVYPPFASVELGPIGARAAEMLEQLMDGQSVPPTVYVPPHRVITYGEQHAQTPLPSEVRAAIAYIASHAGQPIAVDDVAQHVPLSRRALEVRFKQATGHTIYHEIQSQRLDRARALLKTTTWPMHRIAQASGFVNNCQFSRAFHHLLGMTPSQYRKRSTASPGNA